MLHVNIACEPWPLSRTGFSASVPRNESVERAVQAALDAVDRFLGGASVTMPPPGLRQAFDRLIESEKSRVRTATLFLLFYWVVDPSWDGESPPTGLRGKYGDKRLSEQLTQRHITLHGAITAFGENLGWKGNVRNVSISHDPRFSKYLAPVKEASPHDRQLLAEYAAFRFAESQRVIEPLPPVGADVLTFARARVLLHNLVAIPSEGHIPQFLVAALLAVHRRRYGIEIVTHHPHAADQFDSTAGDIEEVRDGDLLRAYEVTVRPDWQNRISNFRDKMDSFGLSKYTIIANNVNTDPDWSQPARMLVKLEPYGRDLAVVDLADLLNVFASELTARELREAINLAYRFLLNQKLSGRTDIIERYRDAVSDWLG